MVIEVTAREGEVEDQKEGMKKKPRRILPWLQSNKFAKCQHIVWYSSIIIFICLALYSVYGTVDDYLSMPTTTSVTVVDVSLDQSQMYLSPEDMYIQLPIKAILFDRMLTGFDYRKNNLTKYQVKSAIKHYDFEDPDYAPYDDEQWEKGKLRPIAHYLRYQFKQSVAMLKTKTELLTKPWDPFIQYAIFQLEFNKRLFERNEFNKINQLCQSKQFREQSFGTDCPLIIQILNMNITPDEFYSKLYKELSTFYSINYYTETQDYTTIYKPKHWQSDDCLLLAFGNSSPCGISIYFQPSLWQHSLWFKIKYDRHHRFNYIKFTWNKDEYANNLTFLSQKYVEEKELIGFGYFDATSGFKTIVSQRILEIFNTTTDCFQQSTARECRIACLQNQLLQDCGCIEHSNRYIDSLSHAPLCSFTNHKPNCSMKIDGHRSFDKVIKAIYEPVFKCEQFCNSHKPCFQRLTTYEEYDIRALRPEDCTDHKSSSSGENSEFDYTSNSTLVDYVDYKSTPDRLTCDLILIIQLDDSLMSYGNFYKQYILDYKISSRDLFSNLGGSLNLWIGIGVINLVHFLFYMTKQLFYLTTRKKTASTDVVNDHVVRKEEEDIAEIVKMWKERFAQLEHQNEQAEIKRKIVAQRLAQVQRQSELSENEIKELKRKLAHLEQPEQEC